MIRFDEELMLLFVNEVPFTKQGIARIKKLIKDGNNSAGDEQFKYAVVVTDETNHSMVMIDAVLIKEITAFIRTNKLHDELAWESDYNWEKANWQQDHN